MIAKEKLPEPTSTTYEDLDSKGNTLVTLDNKIINNYPSTTVY